MKITNLALLSFLAGLATVSVPGTKAAFVFDGFPPPPAVDEEQLEALATLDQTSNDEIGGGDDAIAALRKGGGSGGGVVSGVGGGKSNKKCKSGKIRETLKCDGTAVVTGKVRLTEGLKCGDSLLDDNSETAITVQKDATLDCQGNTIIGPGPDSGTYGIVVYEGGTVKNCKIAGFETGMWTNGASTVTNCVFADVDYALYYNAASSSPKDKFEAKNIYITGLTKGAAYGIYIRARGKTNTFEFESVTIANPEGGANTGIYVKGEDIGGSTITFDKITSAAKALFDSVEGSGTIKIKNSLFDGGGIEYNEQGTSNDIKLSIDKTLIMNAPDYGIDYVPSSSSSSTMDVSTSSVVLSGASAGLFNDAGVVTLDSVEISGNDGSGLYNRGDTTAKNILVQHNGQDGVRAAASSVTTIEDSKVCQNSQNASTFVDIDIDGGGTFTVDDVVCGTDDNSNNICPDPSGSCTALGNVTTTSCVKP